MYMYSSRSYPAVEPAVKKVCDVYSGAELIYFPKQFHFALRSSKEDTSKSQNLHILI